MRYLKTFESVDLENDLRDFCETYLAYLLDGDFELSVIWQGRGYMGPEKDCYNINLCKLDDYSSAAGFTWNEVKDYYIPFIHMLNNEYKIMSNEDLNVGKRFDRQDGGDWKEPCIALYNGFKDGVGEEVALVKRLGLFTSATSLKVVAPKRSFKYLT